MFYKLISGLHTSISLHICQEWLDRKTGQWVLIILTKIMNTDCFYERVGKYPERIENLYFLWAVTTHSVRKLVPLIKDHSFCEGTGDKMKIKSLLKQIQQQTASCEPTFDETMLFSKSSELRVQFRDSFRNISRIMDCVGCEKCRLWGKIQTSGLGTALKILFSEKEYFKSNAA